MQHSNNPSGNPLNLEAQVSHGGNLPGTQVGSLSPNTPHGASNAASTSHPSRIRRRNRMINSCLECRRRKLKCDKSHPCASCTKSSRDCVFLAPALDPASQLKFTEIKEKMGSLERVLEQDIAKRNGPPTPGKYGLVAGRAANAATEFTPEPEDEKHLEPTPLAMLDAAYDDEFDDDLLDLGIQVGKLRITERIGGLFRPKLAEELEGMLTDSRNDRRSPSEKAASPDSLVPDPPQSPNSLIAPGMSYVPPKSTLLLPTKAERASSLLDFLPAKVVADRLIRQYWAAVHPLARTLHKPSFERRYEIFWNEVQVGIEPIGSLQALVFATMFSGVVSISEADVDREFGCSKKDLLENFQLGVETALIRANWLRTTKIETLQAFVMYLIPLFRDQITRAHAALCATAIRIAECMGLHRDGSHFGFGAVECHVRRLIWHQLCFLDIRSCEAQGPKPIIRPDDFDTELPLNVDDVDLEQYPPPQSNVYRWTDVTFSRLRMECNEMHRMLWFDRPRLEKKQTTLTAVLGKIENFRRIIKEKYLGRMDDSFPIQRCAMLYVEVLTRRMHIMILQRYHSTVSQNVPDRLRRMTVTSGVSMLEAAIELETSPTFKQWAWYCGALHSYHVAALLIIDVFETPNLKEADRIWRCLDHCFEVPPSLDRDYKARLILSTIRDKVAAYRNLRNVRAPTQMLDQIDRQANAMGKPIPTLPRSSSDRSSQSPSAPPSINSPPTMLHAVTADTQFYGVTNGEALFGPPPQNPGELGGSMVMQHTGAEQPQDMMADDLMNDIDWNEWDKLFPPMLDPGVLSLG